MTPDERARLIEDIKRSAALRERIVDRARADHKFDIATAWEDLEKLDDSIVSRVIMSRRRDD
jgi:hypothetical protein